VELAREIDGPVAVIGDIHGQVESLERILNQLKALPDYQERWIVFIGDLVDRGPDPKQALDMVVDVIATHPRTTYVCGNHELAMAAALDVVKTPDYCDWAGRWIDHYGCGPTFRSYGIEEIGDFDRLSAALPESHRNLLSNLPWCVEHPQYFFVHAGLDPAAPFELQRIVLQERDYTLTRPQWLCSKSLTFQEPPRDCDRIVVSGHVRVPQVTYGYKRLLVDTTGGEGGSLSCVLLPENQVLSSHPDLAGPPLPMHPTKEPASPPKKKLWFW